MPGAPFFSPGHQLATAIFGAIIDPNNPGFATPLDDAVQAAQRDFVCHWSEDNG